MLYICCKWTAIGAVEYRIVQLCAVHMVDYNMAECGMAWQRRQQTWVHFLHMELHWNMAIRLGLWFLYVNVSVIVYQILNTRINTHLWTEQFHLETGWNFETNPKTFLSCLLHFPKSMWKLRSWQTWPSVSSISLRYASISNYTIFPAFQRFSSCNLRMMDAFGKSLKIELLFHITSPAFCLHMKPIRRKIM